MPDEIFPLINSAQVLQSGKKRVYIGAYGFEERSLGWVKFQSSNITDKILSAALIIRYGSPKGKNKIQELKKGLKLCGARTIREINYDIYENEDIDTIVENALQSSIDDYDEIVLDITALTKFLILVVLDKLSFYNKPVRIIYTEAKQYGPSQADYQKAIGKVNSVIKFPSKGFGTILRSRSLSSIRMQGQPVTLVAFTSFNEQLVRHMLGTLSPHRLVFINGRPPNLNFKWRELATLKLHEKLIEEYPFGNEIVNGRLKRTTSTLYYTEVIECLGDIYRQFALQERIIIAVTGSKMQTVGVFFSKKLFSDIHIEYPTPDSYYIPGYSSGVKQSHEIYFLDLKNFILNL